MIEKELTAADFLSDPYFREWVLWPDAENSLFWEHWFKTHPRQQEEMEWARQLLAAMQQSPHSLPEAKVNKLWAAIEAGIDETPSLPPANPPTPGPGQRSRWIACLLALLAAGLGWLLITNARLSAPGRQRAGN